MAITVLGTVLSSVGRHAEARAQLRRCLAIYHEVGDRWGEAYSTGNLGNALRGLGRYAEAQEQYERALVILREIGDRDGECRAQGSLGAVRLEVGDLRGARRHLELSLARSRELDARSQEGNSLLQLAWVAVEEGDAGAALARVEESLALHRPMGHGSGVLESLLLLGDLRRRAGDDAGARSALDEARTLACGQGARPQLALALAMLACLPGGDVKVAETALSEAGGTGDAVTTETVRFLLWQATHDRTHLVEAKRLLDFLVEHAPPEDRGPMLTNVRLHREIVAACKEEGIA